MRSVSPRTLRLACFPIVLAGVRLAIALVVVAILVGRSAPEAPVDPGRRHAAHPRYVSVLPNSRDGHAGLTPYLLDTENGEFTPCPVTEARNVGRFGCSPWRDGEGRHHLIASALDMASDSYVLLRYTFPNWRFRDLVRIDGIPLGPVCWSPDRSDRILFVGAGSQLYTYDFAPAGRARGREPAAPRQLAWQADCPAPREFWFQRPCWPDVPALGGRVLVSLVYDVEPSQPSLSEHLWWLQLSPDGGAIVAAERAIAAAAGGPDRPPDAETSPAVGVTRDGTALMAYLAQRDRYKGWDLWVMPIAPAAPGRSPQVRPAARRKLAEGCVPGLLAFSAGCRWVYASRRNGVRFRIERYAVGEFCSDPAPPAAVDVAGLP